MTPERKLWHELKRNTPQITWTRLENFAGVGTPDLLGYANSGHFFTVELKVTKANKIRFSPHQISFHITHPKNTFILVKALGPCTLKLFPGSMIQELVSKGFACESGVQGPWSTVVDQGGDCPASRQGNQCRDCRRCWSRDVKHVTNPKH